MTLRPDEIAHLGDVRCGACGHLESLHGEFECCDGDNCCGHSCVGDCECKGERWQGPLGPPSEADKKVAAFLKRAYLPLIRARMQAMADVTGLQDAYGGGRGVDVRVVVPYEPVDPSAPSPVEWVSMEELKRRYPEKP